MAGTSTSVSVSPLTTMKVPVGSDSGLGDSRLGLGTRGSAIDEQWKRAAGSAGGAEHRLFPRVTDAGAKIGAVSDGGGDGLGQVMEVQDLVAHAQPGEPADDAARQRFTVDRYRRFRANVRERPQPGSETGRQHERARQAHALPSNTMSGPLIPSASRRCRNNARYESTM